MESVTGQARRIRVTEKVLDYVKKTKALREQEKERTTLLAALISAKSEFDALRQNLNQITDTDAKEYLIYRLKAAELNFNRHIKHAKSLCITFSPFTEESV